MSEESKALDPDSINEKIISAAILEEQDNAPKKVRYENRTARMMNGFFIGSLLFTILYLGFQTYLSITSYLMQQTPMGIAVLYTFASILMPLIMLVALSFVFRFFAEVLELMDRRNRTNL